MMMVSSISVGVCPFKTSRGRPLSRPRAARGRESTMLPGASVTVRVRWLSARRVISTNRLRRSTRVIRALLESPPMIRSPSQCPGTALSSAWGGRRLMVAPWIQLLPLGSGFSGQWGAGDAAGASGAQGLFHPQLGAQAAGALDVQGLVDLLVTDAHALIIGVLEPQTGGDLPGTDPILQQVDDPLAQGRVGVQLADLGAG